MPTYHYVCDDCGHTFERVQKISDDPLRDCASCGKPFARRAITSGNFILKGSGWYGDLYSGASNSKTGGKSTAAASSTTSTTTESTASTASAPAAAAPAASTPSTGSSGSSSTS